MSFAVDQIVNEGTDYEYKLSLPIRQLINNGTWTPENIAEYVFAGFTDTRVQGICNVPDANTEVTSSSTNRNYTEQYNLTSFQSWSANVPNRIINRKGDAIRDFKFYQRNILVSPANAGSTALGLDSLRLVLDIKDIKKFMFDYDTNPCHSQVTLTSENGTTPTGNGYTGGAYHWGSNITIGPTITSKSTAPQGTTISLHVASICVIDNELWWGYLNPSTNHNEFFTMSGYSRRQFNIYGHSSQAQEYLAGKRGMQTLSSKKYALYAYLPDTTIFPESTDGVSSGSFKDFYVETPTGNIVYAPYLYNNDAQGVAMTASQTISGHLAKTYETLLSWLSWCGIYFKINNVIYKPIISGGVITGYTSDMSKKSEFDNYTTVTGHNIPATPPAGAVGDIETDMPLAYIGGTAGMVNFIKINADGLASADDISDAISRFDITTIGKDLLRNFVAYKCYAVLNIDDSVVNDITVAGHTLQDGENNALQGEYIGSVAPVDFSAGTIEHLYNDYRDYAPYTHIQMYVPFCGWFDLPSWCMGKEITGTMFTDLYNGTVKAVIYASRTVVAEVGGCCAFDIPFAAESTGTKAGAVISSALNTVAMTGATIAAPNIATGIAAVSSAANFISAANANGTTMKGVMGDGSNTNGLLNVYLKITRPNSPDMTKAIPNTYKHEYGVPCFKELTLSAGDGFTQIIDANITGEMTDREKQMIIDGFRHGLIL